MLQELLQSVTGEMLLTSSRQAQCWHSCSSINLSTLQLLLMDGQ
jgi:hypothetical protein